jgi:hypothetical protein
MKTISYNNKIIKVFKALEFGDKDNVSENQAILLAGIVHDFLYVYTQAKQRYNEANNKDTICDAFRSIRLENNYTLTENEIDKCLRICAHFIDDCFDNRYVIEKEFRHQRKPNKKRNWFTYAEASEYCKANIPRQINTLRGLLKYIKENRASLDKRMHSHPHEKYINEWTGIGNFLSDRKVRRSIYTYKCDEASVQKRKKDVLDYLCNYLIQESSASVKKDSFVKLMALLNLDKSKAMPLIYEWIYTLRIDIYKLTQHRYRTMFQNNHYLDYDNYKNHFSNEMEKTAESVIMVKFSSNALENMKDFNQWLINTMANEINYKIIHNAKKIIQITETQLEQIAYKQERETDMD